MTVTSPFGSLAVVEGTMKEKRAAVDYRQFRLSRLNTEQFRHLKLLLYWPIFGLLFWYAERGVEVDHYYPMHCWLDDYIPFNEWFLIPYLFWFAFMVGMHLYTLWHDVPAFRRMMYFIILTYSVSLVIFFLFPNCQQLRPAVFERDNVLTRFLAEFYAFDTSTNVCPSLHVVGSLAAMFAAWDTPRFSSWPWRLAFGVTAALISVSTVFLKQHSVLDILAALVVCAAAYVMIYGRAAWAAGPAPRRGRREKNYLEY